MTSSLNLTEEQSKALELAIINVSTGINAIGPRIDAMTSASLKRVLKAITHVSVAEQMLGRKADPLKDNEQQLVDRIFNLQEDVMGYMTLRNQAELSVNNITTETGEENEQLDQQRTTDSQN